MGKLRFGVLGAAKIAREKVIPPLQRSQRPLPELNEKELAVSPWASASSVAAKSSRM